MRKVRTAREYSRNRAGKSLSTDDDERTFKLVLLLLGLSTLTTTIGVLLANALT